MKRCTLGVLSLCHASCRLKSDQFNNVRVGIVQNDALSNHLYVHVHMYVCMCVLVCVLMVRCINVTIISFSVFQFTDKP